MSGMSIKKERVERNFDREFIIIEKYGARYLASKIVRLFILFFNDLFHNYDKGNGNLTEEKYGWMI